MFSYPSSTIQPWVVRLKDELEEVLRKLTQLSASQMMALPQNQQTYKDFVQNQLEKMTPLQLKIVCDTLVAIQSSTLGMEAARYHDSYQEPIRCQSTGVSMNTISEHFDYEVVRKEETLEQTPFMEKLIGLLANSRNDGAVETMARKIVNYRSGGERASEFSQEDFDKETKSMDMKLLTDVFQAVVVVQKATESFERERNSRLTGYPHQTPHSNNLENTDAFQCLNLLTNNKLYFSQRVEKAMKGTQLGMFEKHAPGTFATSAEDKLRKELHKRLERISQSKLEIIGDAVKILKRNRGQGFQTLEYHRGVEEDRYLPSRYVAPPVHVQDSSGFTNFLSALKDKEEPPVALESPVSTPISVPRKSIEELEQEKRARLEEEENQRKRRQEYEKELEIQKRIAEEKFERDLKDQKSRNDQKENQMRVQTEQLNQKASSEFDEKVRRQAMQHEENLRRAREEIKTFERETQRLMEERVREWNAWNQVFLTCVHMKQLFEEKEREWSSWLDALKGSIAGAKTRFKLFEKIHRNINESQTSYGKIMRNELVSLHKVTLTSYDMIFEACGTVKKLLDKFPERNFLHILFTKLVSISDQICATLEVIDQCNDFGNKSIDRVRGSFASLSPLMVPTTGKLRAESKNETRLEELELKEPREYLIPSSVVFEEVDC